MRERFTNTTRSVSTPFLSLSLPPPRLCLTSVLELQHSNQPKDARSHSQSEFRVLNEITRIDSARKGQIGEEQKHEEKHGESVRRIEEVKRCGVGGGVGGGVGAGKFSLL